MAAPITQALMHTMYQYAASRNPITMPHSMGSQPRYRRSAAGAIVAAALRYLAELITQKTGRSGTGPRQWLRGRLESPCRSCSPRLWVQEDLRLQLLQELLVGDAKLVHQVHSPAAGQLRRAIGRWLNLRLAAVVRRRRGWACRPCSRR